MSSETHRPEGQVGAISDSQAATLLDSYRSLNESFPKKLYFHLGVNAGFFSEFNHMILAMLYCLDRGIQFALYSADANFRVDRGWRDFFEPFCEETEDEFHHLNNYRWLKSYHPHRKAAIAIKKRLRGIDYLTHDLWRKFKNEGFAARRFCIPELGIDGGLLEATRVLHGIVWRYAPPIKVRVEQVARSVDIEPPYIGFHVRGGDKSTEHEVYDTQAYIRAAEDLTSLRRAFVLTDDYRIFDTLREKNPGWRFATTCMPHEAGYYHGDYLQLSKPQKTERLLRLFAAMDILTGSELFVGSFSSNPGMNLGMRMPSSKVHGIDYPSWKIRW